MSTLKSPTNQALLNTLDLKALVQPVGREIEVVEEWLGTNLIDDNPFIAELLSQIFSSGGKRIRVAITLLASKATARHNEELGRLHIILAVLTELIHTASLVHDDVIDSAQLRRGKETVNKKWNDRLAVLLGDLLFAQASICLSRIMNPVIVGIYGQVLGDLCAGEIRQMRMQFSTDVNWDAYITKSIAKTASLFQAGSHSGAILNNAPASVIQNLRDYGLNLGLCFQIVDDLLDVTGKSTELGKQAGSDLRSGVITAPCLFVLEQKDKEAARLMSLIKTRAVQQDDGALEALDIIGRNHGIEKTIKLANDYALLSKEALAALPASESRDSLYSLVDYIVTRTS